MLEARVCQGTQAVLLQIRGFIHELPSGCRQSGHGLLMALHCPGAVRSNIYNFHVNTLHTVGHHSKL